MLCRCVFFAELLKIYNMKKSTRLFKSVLKKIAAAFSLIAILMGIYLFAFRQYQLHWGATFDEVRRSMPGDELDRCPSFLATRAITINANTAAIWPWLVQMGFNRAGFYGYDIIEGIGSKTGMRSADTILPGLQNIKIGEKVPISMVAETRIYAIERNKYLIWAESDNNKANGGFTWALYPIDSQHTRLVSRIRWSYHWAKPGLFSLELFTEFTDHLAVRKILKGIKCRAEGRKPASMFVQSLELAGYFAVLLFFMICVIRMLWLPLNKRRYIISFLAGMLWLIIWYA